jgi:hypothetical protein
MITASPKQSKLSVLAWCPSTRQGGTQPPGSHSEMPEMTGENAAQRAGKVEENRKLGDALVKTLQGIKPGGQFVLQWRIWPKVGAAEPKEGCGCGCSCGCT